MAPKAVLRLLLICIMPSLPRIGFVNRFIPYLTARDVGLLQKRYVASFIVFKIN